MATLRAAKDAGDSKGDKSRRETASALVERASALSEAVDLSAYPEAKEAVDSVASLSDVVAELEVLSVKLKNAPATAACETQKALDEIRGSLDAMLPPMVSTMAAVESLLENAAEMEVLFASLSQQAKDASERLARAKTSLASAAKSLSSARKIG